MTIEGKWDQNSTHLAPKGELSWIDGDRKLGLVRSVGVIDGKVVCSTRKVQGGHVASIEGWQWKVMPGSGEDRMNRLVQGGRKVEFTPNKIFKRLDSAKKECAAILETIK